jgi:hypothetical protein
LLLTSLLFRNVPRDLGRSNDFAFTVFYWRNCQRDYNSAAVLALPDGLEMIETLPASDSRQYHAFLILPVLWNDNRNRLANGLFGSVAKNPLGTPVPASNDAVEIFTYDGVITGVDDRRQPARSLFAFAKHKFKMLALGNVAVDFKHGAIAEQLHSAVDNDLTAVLADVPQLARPETPIRKLRAQFGERNRKSCLQQSMAITSHCLFRRKPI